MLSSVHTNVKAPYSHSIHAQIVLTAAAACVTKLEKSEHLASQLVFTTGFATLFSIRSFAALVIRGAVGSRFAMGATARFWPTQLKVAKVVVNGFGGGYLEEQYDSAAG
jgi:hypothetical protein